ncbi:baeRF2 domain-containing protein [Nocardioides xinjiangensis]|uniref:baeRF2 domain-containing protein n=1 Tax=Nocardioides xinjiangensis TaxID=2817376 RepID=UPI001B30C72A|nr:Vms1/Ankzf1 family peptidyl-tRNA hydrolase [Nocardioides sp. SYSU D00778]
MTMRRPEALSTLRRAAELYGDVVTAYVDVSRASETGAREVELRADNVRRELLESGAAEDLVETVVARLTEPTGHGGDASRVVVAHDGTLVTDLVLAGAVAGHQHHGPVAHLLELARAMSDDVRYAVVRVDHTGADITLASTIGAVERELTSEGDHDVLHKVKGGGWSHRRFQMRVQDSQDQNADTVARDLDSLLTKERVDLVLLTGEPSAVSRVSESAGQQVSERLQVLEHGGRAEGADDEQLDEEVAAAVQRCRSLRIDEVLDRLGPADAPKAIGVGETLEALRRGEVETLILQDGALDDRRAYAGPDPMLLATDPEELRSLGVEEPAAERLDELLLRAAIAQDADLLPLHAPIGALPDGVGAVLRFSSRPDPRPSTRDDGEDL